MAKMPLNGVVYKPRGQRGSIKNNGPVSTRWGGEQNPPKGIPHLKHFPGTKAIKMFSKKIILHSKGLEKTKFESIRN